MKRFVLPAAVLLVSLAASAQANAPERGGWRAVSHTAMAITGDVFFADEKFTINFSTYPLAEIRALKPDEIRAAFDPETVNGAGNLFRLSIPGTKRFLHKNTLCGAEDTQWMATYASGKDLEIAFFSGATMPVFTPDGIGNSTSLCGTFSYAR